MDSPGAATVKEMCDHADHWVSIGVTPLRTPEAMIFFHSTLCTHCGHVDVKVMSVEDKKKDIVTPKPPGIVVPK